MMAIDELSLSFRIVLRDFSFKIYCRYDITEYHGKKVYSRKGQKK